VAASFRCFRSAESVA